jgi:hypothetical protein
MEPTGFTGDVTQQRRRVPTVFNFVILNSVDRISQQAILLLPLKWKFSLKFLY